MIRWLSATARVALSVTAGVGVAAVLSRKTQDRHWLRDKQFAAYQEWRD